MGFPAPSDRNRVDLGHGVSCQWLHDGAIIAFYVSDANREAIDTWSDAIDQAAALKPENQPMLLLHNLPEFPVTPYFRARSKDIATRYKDKRFGKSALVVPLSSLEALTRFFTERDLPRISQSFERRAFTDQQEAIDWLLEPLADQP